MAKRNLFNKKFIFILGVLSTFPGAITPEVSAMENKKVKTSDEILSDMFNKASELANAKHMIVDPSWWLDLNADLYRIYEAYHCTKIDGNLKSQIGKIILNIGRYLLNTAQDANNTKHLLDDFSKASNVPNDFSLHQYSYIPNALKKLASMLDLPKYIGVGLVSTLLDMYQDRAYNLVRLGLGRNYKDEYRVPFSALEQYLNQL